MATKRCCCNLPSCVPCAEKADLASWAVYESIMGFVFSGEFDPLNATNCSKTGCECQRQDNIEVGEVASTSPWSPWGGLFTCGACLDCETGTRPPPCFQDPFTGEIICPPGYPTYEIYEFQTRTGMREKLWYSKGVEMCVTARYIGADRIQFTATVRFALVGATTASYATRRRWRKRELECESNRVIDPGTPSSGDTVGVPAPLPPCEDLLGDVGRYCEPYIPPVAPDPCEESEIVLIEDPACEKRMGNEIAGFDCVDVAESVPLTVYAARNCCDDGELCLGSGDIGTIVYQSEIFLCSEVPSSIELTPTVTPPAEIRIEFTCDEGITPPADVVFAVPETLTLTVANTP